MCYKPGWYLHVDITGYVNIVLTNDGANNGPSWYY